MDKNKLNQAIAELIKDPNRRDAMAEILVEYIQPNHLATQFVSDILSTRSLKPGDSLVKKMRKGIEVRTLVPGSIHLANEITVTERMNYILDGADIKVTYNAWEMESGEIGTVSEIKREMAAKLHDFYMNKVFTVLSTVWSAGNTPDNYTAMGGTITSAALEAAIDQINFTTTGAKAIIGVRSVVQPITKFAAFWSDGTNTAGSQKAIDEIRDRGYLGKFYGVPIIALNQVYDNPEDYTKLLPTDKLLVIGEDVGEFITYGDVKRMQWVDMNPTPPQWFLEIYQQFGLIIDNAMGIHVVGGIS